MIANNKELLKKIIIDSQIYVSIMATFLSVFFISEQNIKLQVSTILLIFVTYLCGYLYTKYRDSQYFLRVLSASIILGMVCIIFIIRNHNWEVMYKWLVIIVLGMFYNSSFLKIQMRDIPFLKIFHVGLVWALVNSWLMSPSFNLPIFFISLLFISALILPFDIRDIEVDEIKTFPKIIGIKRSKILAFIMLGISLALSGIFLSSYYFYSFALTIFISLVFIIYSRRSNPPAYFYLGVESCSGLPLMFLIADLHNFNIY